MKPPHKSSLHLRSSDRQRSGLGTRLVNEALTQLESQGVALVFVLGYPDYYTRFGFAPAGTQGFDAPYSILPKNADAWMVKNYNREQSKATKEPSAAAPLSTNLSIGKSESRQD